MEDDRDRRAALLGGMEAAFQPPGRTVEKTSGIASPKTRRPCAGPHSDSAGPTGAAKLATNSARAYVSDARDGRETGT